MSQYIGMTGNPWWIGVMDEEKDTRYKPRYYWNYQFRHWVQTQQDQVNYVTLWPSARLQSGDPTVPMALSGQDGRDGGIYDVPEYGVSGSARPYYIDGNCQDSLTNPLTGVIVQAYLTSNEAFVGMSITDSNGNYSIPTTYIGNTHYLVAYLPGGEGSGDMAGTTVNTIIPTIL